MSNFVRDPSSKFIINNDDSHYKAILAARQGRKEAEEMCAKLQSLEREMTEIKDLLKQVVTGRTNG